MNDIGLSIPLTLPLTPASLRAAAVMLQNLANDLEQTAPAPAPAPTPEPGWNALVLKDLPDLIGFIKGHKVTQEKVNATVMAYHLSSLHDLAAKPELIPGFAEALLSD